MADKGRVHHRLRQLQHLKTWQLLVVLLLVGFVAATFLRLNNIGMVERRQAVMDADKAGDKLVIQNRLYDLQRYVQSHMNTSMGDGIYLEYQYQRDRQAVIDTAANANNPNGNIYKQITDECRAQYSQWNAYFSCVTERLNASTPANDPLKSVVMPPVELYRHAYVSPLWSADFAGFSVLVFALILLVLIARLITLGVLQVLLRRRQRGLL